MPPSTTPTDLPPCPDCHSPLTYEDAPNYVCPECAHEWPIAPSSPQPDPDDTTEITVKDASGNPLQPGDSVTVIKDLKVKGSSSVVKVGTKVKNIRLVPGDHPIDCKIPGIGDMRLKAEFVRKS